MRTAKYIITAATAVFGLLFVSDASAEQEMPKLQYVDEYTNTQTVRDIAVFADKIWTATEGGISVYNRKDGRFLFNLTSRNGLFGNSIRRLMPSAQNTLSVGGDYGDAEISAACAAPTKTCFTAVHKSASSEFNPIMDLVLGTNGPRALRHQSGLDGNCKPWTGMWRAAATGEPGVLVGGMDGRLLLLENPSDPSSLPKPVLKLDKPVLQIAAVKEGFLVLAGAKLLLLKNNRTAPVLHGSTSVGVTALSRNGKTVLVGSATGEIFSVHQDALTPIAKLDGRVTAILDDGNAIWAGVDQKGLFRISKKTKTAAPAPGHPGEICSNHVTHVTTFGGRTVAGTFDNGACVLQDGTWLMLEGPAGQYVHGVAQDGKYLWVATSRGIARYDAEWKPVPLTDADPKEVRWLTASAVTALAETEDGIALGSPWGVIRVTRSGDTYSARFLSQFRGAPPQLTALASTQTGLLISSETGGVHFVGSNRKDTRIYLDPVHLPEAWILDVSVAREGFWAASCQSGVSFVNGDTATVIDRSDGLADNRTVSVAAYKDGAFVATLSGLSFAKKTGTSASPWTGSLPDPRGAMTSVQGNRLFFGTESGTAVFEIER